MAEPIDAQRVNPGTLWQRRDGGGNLGKDLINAGKESRDLLMRTRLDNTAQALNIVALRDYLREFDITEDDAIVQDLLALLPSVGGQSRYEYVEVSTGLMMDNNKKSIFGGKKKENNQNEQQSNA